MRFQPGEGPRRGLLRDCTTGCGTDGALHSTKYDVVRCSAERESCPGAKHDLPREQGEGPRQGRGVQAEE